MRNRTVYKAFPYNSVSKKVFLFDLKKTEKAALKEYLRMGYSNEELRVIRYNLAYASSWERTKEGMKKALSSSSVHQWVAYTVGSFLLCGVFALMFDRFTNPVLTTWFITPSAFGLVALLSLFFETIFARPLRKFKITKL